TCSAPSCSSATPMSKPKRRFTWPSYERVTIIDMKGEEVLSVRMIGSDVVVPDAEAAIRYSISLSHIDRLDARGEAPPAIRLGDRLKGRWASAWYTWELKREIRRPLPAPALPAETVVPKLPEAAAPPRRRRSRSRPAVTTAPAPAE